VDPKSRSIVVLAVLLLAAELGLRAVERAPEPRLPADRPVAIVLGTSRARAGVDPGEAEVALFQSGVYRPWVANASVEAATMVGLHETYLREVHPLAAGAGEAGEPVVIAIEVRGSGLNDAYVAPEERGFVERHRFADAGLVERSLADLLAAGEIDAAADAMLGRLRIARGDELLRPRLTGWLHGADEPAAAPGGGPDAGDAPLTGDDAAWAVGDRGWAPYSDVQEPGLRVPMWERHYKGKMLKDYTLGGVQTEHLRQLVRRVRADGFRAVLFNMPVTGIQRGFFAEGDYARYLQHVRAVAAEEGVAFVDLDSALELPQDAFVDTHHLRYGAVAGTTREVALRVLLPAFRGR
jgi:hypothetical protein